MPSLWNPHVLNYAGSFSNWSMHQRGVWKNGKNNMITITICFRNFVYLYIFLDSLLQEDWLCFSSLFSFFIREFSFDSSCWLRASLLFSVSVICLRNMLISLLLIDSARWSYIWLIWLNLLVNCDNNKLEAPSYSFDFSVGPSWTYTSSFWGFGDSSSSKSVFAFYKLVFFWMNSFKSSSAVDLRRAYFYLNDYSFFMLRWNYNILQNIFEIPKMF